MREFFAAHLGRLNPKAESLESCRIPRVFPRKDDSYVVQYDLELRIGGDCGSTRMLFCGLSYSAPDGVHPAEAAGYDSRHCISHPDIGLTVPIFPFDPGLPALADLWDGAKAPGLLARLASHRSGLPFEPAGAERTVLGYRLERRCTMALSGSSHVASDAGFRLVAKVAPPRKIARIMATVAKLEEAGWSGTSADGLTIPALIGADEKVGVILMEHAPGVSLHELLGQADFLPASAAAGRLLRRLHDLKGFGATSPAHTPAGELADLAVWTRRLCTIFPSCASLVEEVHDMLRAHAVPDPTPAELGPIHRDFYDKQVLYAKGRATLLDFDNMSMGDAAQDVGNFLAHLELRCLQQAETRRAIGPASAAFIDAYGRFDARFKSRVRWWQAAALLRLASLYALRPQWRHLTPELVDYGRRYLDKGAPVPKGVRS
jgi:Ser/Thr protein kinase RdoA (MazF antagonist)